MKQQPTTPFEKQPTLEEVLLAYHQAVEAGRTPDRQELLARHRHLAEQLADLFDDEDHVNPLLASLP